MGIISLLLYCCFAIILFLVLNYSYKRSGSNYNNMFRIIFPIVYIIILAGIFTNIGFSEFDENIFLIVVFEFIFRIYYVNYILKQDVFVNDKYYFKVYVISIILSYLTNIYFINKIESVFPTPDEMRVIIWILIILAMCVYFKNNFNLDDNDRMIENDKFNSRKNEYLIVSYAKLRHKYGKFINTKNKDVVNIIYSIMIYENHHRPAFIRQLDFYRNKLFDKKIKQGIMQVDSKKIIDDEVSINIVCEKIEKLYIKFNAGKKINNEELVSNILLNYYKKEESYKDVLNIYLNIVEFSNIN